MHDTDRLLQQLIDHPPHDPCLLYTSVIKAPGPGGVRFEHYSPMPVDAQASATFRPPADELVVMEGKEQRLLDLTEADQLPHWSAPYRSLRSGQMTPVSYTHLDVYKRQELDATVAKRRRNDRAR